MIEFSIVIVVLVLDRITKLWAMSTLRILGSIPIVKDIFHLTYATNTGAAFSILNQHTWLLTLVSILAVGGFSLLLYFEKRAHGFGYTTVALAFIIGGALGNLYDRMAQGYVVDFFDFRAINFAIFNVADCFIVVGTAILLIFSFFMPGKTLLKKRGH